MRLAKLTVIVAVTLSGCATYPSEVPQADTLVIQNQSCMFFCEAQVEQARDNQGPVQQSESQTESAETGKEKGAE